MVGCLIIGLLSSGAQTKGAAVGADKKVVLLPSSLLLQGLGNLWTGSWERVLLSTLLAIGFCTKVQSNICKEGGIIVSYCLKPIGIDFGTTRLLVLFYSNSTQQSFMCLVSS